MLAGVVRPLPSFTLLVRENASTGRAAWSVATTGTRRTRPFKLSTLQYPSKREIQPAWLTTRRRRLSVSATAGDVETTRGGRLTVFESGSEDRKIWVRDNEKRCVAPVGDAWSVSDLADCLESDLGLKGPISFSNNADTLASVALSRPEGITITLGNGQACNLSLSNVQNRSNPELVDLGSELELLCAKQNLLRAIEAHQSVAISRNEFETEFASEIVRLTSISHENTDAVLKTLSAAGVVALDAKFERVIIHPKIWLQLAERFEDRAPFKPAPSPSLNHVKRNEEEEDAVHSSPLAAPLRWGITTSVVGLYSYLFYLTYSYLSWDIVEPITFFVASGLSLMGYFWWLLTSSDLSYSSVLRFFLKRK